MKRIHWKSFLPYWGIPVSLFFFVIAGYFYFQYKAAEQKLTLNSGLASEESKKIVAEVSKIMILPSGEEPTVATVTDPDKLKNQSFFLQSKTGDKVLIYTQAKKAVLYRPSSRLIVDVAPVNIGSQSAGQPETAEGAEPRFVLLNGTGVTGLTKTYESKLKSLLSNAVVVDRDNAKSKTYDKTILVDLTGQNRGTAQEIAMTLGIGLRSMPQGETVATGSADFLIIVGSDQAP